MKNPDSSKGTYEKYRHFGKSDSLQLPGLHPSDYFLFKQIRDRLDLSISHGKNDALRRVFTLGLRWVYSGWYDPKMRGSIIHLASEVKVDDLDNKNIVKVYKNLDEIEKGL